MASRFHARDAATGNVLSYLLISRFVSSRLALFVSRSCLTIAETSTYFFDNFRVYSRLTKAEWTSQKENRTHDSAVNGRHARVVLLEIQKAPATAKSTARPSCLVGVLYDNSREKICWWLINHFHVATKVTEFGEITQNNGHCAVQGHSRSPILVPIESPYTTSY